MLMQARSPQAAALVPVLLLVLVGAVGVARAASPREGWQDVQILSGRSTVIGVPSGVAGRGRGANPGAAGIAWTQQLDGAADDSGGAEGAAEADAAEDAAEDDVAQVPAAPVVPVADNYEAATNADDLITKALEHGTLSAAQAKTILAGAKAGAAADAAKVAAAKRIVEAAKSAEGEAASAATTANKAAAEAAAKVAEDEKQLREDEQAAGPPAAVAQQRQAALNSANQRLAAAMAYAATQTRNMDRALAAETAAKEAGQARAALADAKVMADNAQIAASNLADVSGQGGGQGGGGVSGGSSQAGIGQADSSLGEKVGIAFFFVLLAIALLIWWFQFGRGGDLSGGLAAGPSTYGAYSFGRVGSTA